MMLENIIYINLDERRDRRQHFENEMKKIGAIAQRFSAIKHSFGAIGCAKSHIECLKIAIEKNWSHVCICEDDLEIIDEKQFLQSFHEFEKNPPEKWDVLLIGGNNYPPSIPYNNYSIKIMNCQTTTGYIVKKEYYNKLLDNFQTGLSLLEKNINSSHDNRKYFIIDIFWKQLQKADDWFLLFPLSIIQYTSYSDIEKKTMNYSTEMLNIKMSAPPPPHTKPRFVVMNLFNTNLRSNI